VLSRHRAACRSRATPSTPLSPTTPLNTRSAGLKTLQMIYLLRWAVDMRIVGEAASAAPARSAGRPQRPTRPCARAVPSFLLLCVLLVSLSVREGLRTESPELARRQAIGARVEARRAGWGKKRKGGTGRW
jgi:hypothetical protein